MLKPFQTRAICYLQLNTACMEGAAMEPMHQPYTEQILCADSTFQTVAQALCMAAGERDTRQLVRQACLSAMNIFNPDRVGLTCIVEDVFVTVCFLSRGNAPSELMVDGNMRTGFVLPKHSISESVRKYDSPIIRSRADVLDGPLAPGLIDDGVSHTLLGLPWYQGSEMGGTCVMWFNRPLHDTNLENNIARFVELLSVAFSSLVMVGERGIISGVVGLSPREQETLRAIGTGLTNKEIAQELGISLNTVKEYVRAVLKKTGCRNRSEAAIFFSRSEAASIAR